MIKLNFQKSIKSTSHIIVKMRQSENISVEILGGVCNYFKCDVSEVLRCKNENTND